MIMMNVLQHYMFLTHLKY